MAENGGPCTMIVWCSDCNGAGSQASAHVYDGDGHYLYSTKVDGAMCLGGCGVVVYNMDNQVVRGQGSGQGPQTPMAPYHAATNFSRLIEAGEDHSTHVPADGRFAAEQSVMAGNYRLVQIPEHMLSARARMLRKKHQSSNGAPSLMRQHLPIMSNGQAGKQAAMRQHMPFVYTGKERHKCPNFA